MASRGRMEQKVVIVTGATQAVSAEQPSNLFAEEGAYIIIADTQESNAKKWRRNGR